MSADWPYDAAQHDPLTALRIPVVADPFPSWYYLICLVINDEQDMPWHGVRPTDDEVRLLLDELEFERSWYREGYLAHMAERPYDIDSGFNSLAFVKRGPGNWAYRRRTWTGPQLAPSTYDGQPALDLPALLDRVHDLSDRWDRWKANRTTTPTATREEGSR